jgi:hypothetical protein
MGGMRKVEAVQCFGIQEDRHSEVEADAVLPSWHRPSADPTQTPIQYIRNIVGPDDWYLCASRPSGTSSNGQRPRMNDPDLDESRPGEIRWV